MVYTVEKYNAMLFDFNMYYPYLYSRCTMLYGIFIYPPGSNALLESVTIEGGL